MQRPRSASHNKHKGEPLTFLAAVALLLVALFGGGIGFYVWATATRPPVRDQRTLCPVDGPTAATVMLLDTSDPLPPVAREEVLKDLSDIVDGLPDYALLDVRILDPAYPAGRVVFDLCNPGDGRGLNEFTGNPTLAKRRWRERFREPLEQALRGGLTPQPSKISPLLATLQGIAVERFTGKAVATIPKALVIVSDMMENTPDYNQYVRRDLSYAQFKTTTAYLKYRTDLNRAAVQILYAQRSGRQQVDPAAHIRFWIEWINDNRGDFKKAKTLQGLGTVLKTGAP